MNTIILPIYQTKKNFRIDIQSVLLQTYRDREYIVVDDVSKDDTSEICDEHVLRNERTIKHIDNKPLVSVLMSVYHEPKEVLKKAIDSILGQSYDYIQYVIIIDDPQNRDALALISEYGDERIECYVNSQNIGLVRSLNKGLEKCRGEFVARMDADDISMPHRIENQVKRINELNCDVIGSDIEIMIDENIQGNIIRCPIHHRQIIKAIRYDNCVKHPTWMVRREVFSSMNGYRNIFSCEDYDFLLRCIQEGYTLGNTGTVELRYRQGETSISRSNRGYQQTVFEKLASDFSRAETSSEGQITQYMSSENATFSIRDTEEYMKLKKERRIFKLIWYPLFYKETFRRIKYKIILLQDHYSR